MNIYGTASGQNLTYSTPQDPYGSSLREKTG
jgi:hypothetical protein